MWSAESADEGEVHTGCDFDQLALYKQILKLTNWFSVKSGAPGHEASQIRVTW